MSNDLPKFRFAASTIKTTADLDKKLLESEDKSQKHFRPGKYEVKIIAAVHQGPASDKTWQKFLFTMKGAGPAEITHQVMVPYETLEYVGRKGPTLFMYQKLVSFMAGFGVALTPENLEETLTTYFGGNIEKAFVGKQLSIDVGYRGNFIKYVGKSAAGTTQYQIQLQNGTLLPTVFPDFDAAVNWAGNNNTEVSRFVEVTGVAPSANGAAAGTAGLKAANW